MRLEQCLPSENSDLWARLRHALIGANVVLKRVKGHASSGDVASGAVTGEDKAGNDGADKLAVAGALMAPLPEGLLERAAWRKDTARSVQRMMVSILQKRWQHPASLAAVREAEEDEAEPACNS